MIKNFIGSVCAKLKKEELWISEYKNKRVLDIGCGRGGRILKHGNSWCGVDVNESVIGDAKSKGADIKIGDATKLPFKSEMFDAVLSHHIIEHLTPEQAHKHLKEAARVLKPKGVMILATPTAIDSFWGTFSHVRPYPPSAIKKMTTYASGETFEKIPLKIIDIFYFGYCSVQIPIISTLLLGIYTFLANVPIAGKYFAGSYIMKLVKE